MKKSLKRGLAWIMAVVMALAVSITPVTATPATDSPGDADINYLRLYNHSGPSGVPLGGAGVGYYEISPEGKFTRNCINNIHKSFIDSPSGMFLATWQGGKAARLQRDSSTLFGMQGYSDSYYTGLFPRIELGFENAKQSGVAGASFKAYSGVVAQNVKDSSLPVTWYEVTLSNDSDTPQEMSAMLSWADLIGRGIKDTTQFDNANFNPDGESSYWFNMSSPSTTAENITIGSWKGIKQSAPAKIMPNKMTFQNYNTDFVILAEETADTHVSALKSYSLSDSAALSQFVQNGKFAQDDGKVALSAAQNNASNVTSASAVAVSATVAAKSTKTVKFLVSWFMPEYTEADMALIPSKAPYPDYNKYYHNYFQSVEQIVAYAQDSASRIYSGVLEWQQPILDSNLPDFLKFKEINSAYTLFSNGVLNKRMNFTTLEGEMGGYGGTMDQKMSSHPMYEKLFPELNLNENRQFANVLGANGEIQHFDVHYYVGMSDSDPANRYNPVPNGSMIDNSGAWMVQMLNYYKQTGDDTYIRQYYSVMKNSMAFLKTKFAPGTNIPNYNTTYDDYSHPEILIFSGIVYLNMLDIAAQIATINNEPAAAADFRAQYALTYTDVQKLYVDKGDAGFYPFGSSALYISSNKASGEIKDGVMFSGAMAGQFISRYSGDGDIVPFDSFVKHMKEFITTSVQQTGDYFAPKVFDIREGIGLDNPGSRCWPFYLDSYGAMAAIQAGYVEDGFEIMEHTQLVHFRSGYTWTQNLWNPGYSTYMTAPVVWFVNDVLAGSSINVPQKTLTLGPTTVPGTNKLVTPLYYPKYWATLTYDKDSGAASYKIIKTFYKSGEQPIVFNTLNIAPNGKAAASKTSHTLSFTVTEGATLDLSAYMGELGGNISLPKSLTPMPKYNPSAVQNVRSASGTGLTMKTFNGLSTSTADLVSKSLSTEVNYTWAAGQKPSGVTADAYTVQFVGSILPKFGQTYELRFVAKGDISLKFNGRQVDAGEFKHETQNGSIVLPEGCTLYVFTANLNGNQMYPIELTYKNPNAAAGGVIGFMWWSTTQTPEYLISTRMYPELSAYETIRAIDYTALSGNLRQTNDYVDYIENNNWITYNGVDFGEEGFKRGTIQLMIGGPANDVCNGGTVELRKDSASGQLLGTAVIGTTSGWGDYKAWSGNIDLTSPLTGKQNICLVFKCPKTFLGNMKSFTFKTGLVQSAFETITATKYSNKSGRIMPSSDGGNMEYIENNNWLQFGLDFGDNFVKGNVSAWMSVSESDNCNGGSIEVREGSPTGTLLGTIVVTPTSGWGDYRQFTGDVSLSAPLSGVHNVYFVYKSNLTFIGNSKSFIFTSGVVSAYNPIPATGYIAKDGRITPSGDGSNMEYIENNNWLKFSLDFGTGIKTGIVGAEAAVLESGNCNGGTVDVRLGSPTGDLIASVTITPTSGWGDYRIFNQQFALDTTLSGVQDIYFVCRTNRTFLGNIKTFRFSGTIQAYSPFLATSYTDKSGRITPKADGTCMEYIAADNWMAFDNVDFGAGMLHGKVKIEAAVARDSANDGGTIEVRLGSETGELIGSVVITNTGSWSNYQWFEADLNLTQPLSGLQKIYFVARPKITFAGNIRSIVFASDAGTIRVTVTPGAASLAAAAGTDLVSGVTVQNNTDAAVAYSVIAALYDRRGALVSINPQTLNVAGNSDASASLSVAIPQTPAGYTLKLFVWDAKTFEPVTNATTIN